MSDNAYVFDLPIPAGARYLTLAVGDAGDGIGCDHGIFGNAILAAGVPSRFDLDGDYDVDGQDYQAFLTCCSGPRIPVPSSCQALDIDGDGDVDQDDFSVFQRHFTGSR